MALPTAEAATLALRTQQLLAWEHGVASTADPLGGSWFVEALTDRIEAEAVELMARIAAIGGVIPAIESGFFGREIAESAYVHQRAVEAGERVVVGVNAFVADDELAPTLHRADPDVERRQRDRLAAVRSRRDGAAVERTLAELAAVAGRGRNVMDPLIAAARVEATLGEMCDALKPAFGLYRETPAF
jgi:methylmalonyl-CoA mutase N-terminal domain/subunit